MNTPHKTGRELILQALQEKASTKQKIYRTTLKIFEDLKKTLKEIQADLNKEIKKVDKSVEISYEAKGTFEAEIKFSGDVLIFSMHTNVFTFNDDHFIHKTGYVEEDPSRAYCGTIQIYNFLTDSFKYNRSNDVGYLIARIFINKEKHFFVEGKRQLGFLYTDFENITISKESIKAIIESAMLYAIDFDLLVPPYNEVKELTLLQKIQQTGTTSFKTGKRLGFRFEADSEKIS